MDAYTGTFKKMHLLGQIIAHELVNYANESRPVGFRADGLGEDYHMNVYFPRNIYEMKDVWKKAPVSFETFWTLGEWHARGWDIDSIIEESLKWHVSTVNAKSSPIPFEWKDKIDAWLKKMGYRFSVRLVEYPGEAMAGDTLSLNLWIENSGVAPIYNRLPLTVRIKNEKRVYAFESDADARKWMPGDNIEKLEFALPDDAPCGEYSLWIRLGGEDKPCVKFASDTVCDGEGYCFLADFCVRSL